MRLHLLAFALFLCSTLKCVESQPQRRRPVYGILTIRLCRDNVHHVLPTYVSWLDRAGADVVAIDSRAPAETQQKIFSQINGLILPGANRPGNHYLASMRRFIRWARESNEQGRHFPIIGVCYGMQRMANILARKNMLSNFRHQNSTAPMKLMGHFRDFRSIANLNVAQANSLQTQDTVFYNHRFGISPQAFTNNRVLNSTFTIVGTAFTPNGAEYVTMYEGRSLPFYGVQHHPETFRFNNKPGQVNLQARRIRAALARFAVAQARKNTHRARNLVLIQDANDLVRNGAYIFLGPREPYLLPKETGNKITIKDCSNLVPYTPLIPV
uniref:folate gamma-glutamyl hydrolase n=1 Tax=Mucochytrium quahogii TaxID=96639 RepID=A0A7S2W1L0_9STRA|mmetsp:Transcript_10731/g.23190  ORF Transcript_10731/g.23190 Transcript_10731/m.23190 type:complete len:326 (+) Transcript_10731:96-1073(+)